MEKQIPYLERGLSENYGKYDWTSSSWDFSSKFDWGDYSGGSDWGNSDWGDYSGGSDWGSSDWGDYGGGYDW
ncbi:MAG: hypothetical protein K6A35_09315 [bacterium]|nr:hypothetical protein [bacterium]